MVRLAKPANIPLNPRKKKRKLRDLSRDDMPAFGSEMRKWEHELETSSDRHAAIIGSLLAEDALWRLIVSHLDRHDPTTLEGLRESAGPLSTFSAMIVLAHAMGYIDERSKAQLTHIRHVRNAFAHTLKPIGFDTPEILEECEKLCKHLKMPVTSDSVRNGFLASVFHVSHTMTKATTARYKMTVATLKAETDLLRNHPLEGKPPPEVPQE